ATSGPFSVTASTGTATLSESPASVGAGASVTATRSGIASPTASDWIGLFAPGAEDGSALNWVYGSWSTSAGDVRASGSCSLPVPAGLSGSFELRLFASNGFTRLATSATFIVAP